MSTPFTRSKFGGVPHANIASEVAPDAFCGATPKGLDTASFRGRPWRASGSIADGSRFNLGGRTITVLSVPGHTPDAIALLDRDAGLLFTGDSYYPGPIWLFLPETDLAAYERSIIRLASLAPSLKRLLTTHSLAVDEPAQLPKVRAAIRAVRSNTAKWTTPEPGQRLYAFDGFSILVSERALSVRRE
jgi:glyoxylase-like metal-dependent hydrolase (beta-lactamase superfamily II)